MPPAAVDRPLVAGALGLRIRRRHRAGTRSAPAAGRRGEQVLVHVAAEAAGVAGRQPCELVEVEGAHPPTSRAAPARKRAYSGSGVRPVGRPEDRARAGATASPATTRRPPRRPRRVSRQHRDLHHALAGAAAYTGRRSRPAAAREREPHGAERRLVGEHAGRRPAARSRRAAAPPSTRPPAPS